MRTLTLALLAACGTAASPTPDDSWAPGLPGTAPPPPTIAVDGACPGPMTVDVADLTPGARFVLLVGDTPGSDTIPFGTCAGIATGLDGPERLFFNRATPAGTRSYSPEMPDPYCGRWVQAVDLDTCTSSPAVQIGGDAAGVRHPLGVGQSTACALEDDGHIACWGDPGADGLELHVPAGPGYTSVTPGQLHACALDADGMSACWGLSLGEPGFDLGQVTDVPAGPFEELIAFGRASTCGILAGGDVECWGEDLDGRVSDAPDGVFHGLSLGDTHTCVLDAAGEAHCWGANDSGELDAPAGPWASIHAGFQRTCAIDAAGAGTCWGYDGDGGLTPPDAGPWLSLDPAETPCGLRTDGTLACWGDSRFGPDLAAAVPPGSDFVALDVATPHACAQHADGTVECFGVANSGSPYDPGNCSTWSGHPDLDGDGLVAGCDRCPDVSYEDGGCPCDGEFMTLEWDATSRWFGQCTTAGPVVVTTSAGVYELRWLESAETLEFYITEGFSAPNLTFLELYFGFWFDLSGVDLPALETAIDIQVYDNYAPEFELPALRDTEYFTYLFSTPDAIRLPALETVEFFTLMDNPTLVTLETPSLISVGDFEIFGSPDVCLEMDYAAISDAYTVDGYDPSCPYP